MLFLQLSPPQGIVAGCSAATSLVKAYYASPFRSLLGRWQSIGVSLWLSVYLDDITIAGTHTSIDQAVEVVGGAAEEIATLVAEELHCRIAAKKTVCLSSSKAAARRLARRCGGETAVRLMDAASVLGVEARAGGAWRLPAGQRGPRVRAVRLAAARRRFRRGAFFRRLAGKKSRTLFVAGPRAVAGYGAEVTGLADPVVRALRSMATQHLGIRGRHSQTAALLLHGDPVLPLATAAARRWAQEVWRADFL